MLYGDVGAGQRAWGEVLRIPKTGGGRAGGGGTLLLSLLEHRGGREGGEMRETSGQRVSPAGGLKRW